MSSASPTNSASEGVQLSIVAPMFNEAANLDRLFERLTAVLSKLAMSYEIICVNDGSSDDTLQKLLAHRAKNPAIKIVDLSRNFGKDIALTAGIDHARGAAVVPIDSDLQDPPELIEELVKKWREGYEVVYATRRSRQGESWFKQTTASFFYRIFDHLTDVKMPRNTGDFRLLDRKAVDALTRLPERSRFMKGLFAWVGFKQTSVMYDREARHAGETKWNYWRLWNFALDGITSFSSLPLRVWTYAGMVISSLAFFYATFLIIRVLVKGKDVEGYASTIVVILFLGGIQLITLGVLGEYLGRIYVEVKARPLYLVREVHGVEKAKEPRVKVASTKSTDDNAEDF
jgi:glycosyltransferase involved in cell wall biosynthesis